MSFASALRKILGFDNDDEAKPQTVQARPVRTHLSPTQINLLASLTAYNVVAPETRQLFLDLFAPA